MTVYNLIHFFKSFLVNNEKSHKMSRKIRVVMHERMRTGHFEKQSFIFYNKLCMGVYMDYIQ